MQEGVEVALDLLKGLNEVGVEEVVVWIAPTGEDSPLSPILFALPDAGEIEGYSRLGIVDVTASDEAILEVLSGMVAQAQAMYATKH